MHVVDTLGASFFVKIVDILRAEEEAIRQGAFESGKSEVGGIRFCRGGRATALGVEVPD